MMYPDLRLFQLLGNLSTYDEDPYHKEDDEFMRRLRETYPDAFKIGDKEIGDWCAFYTFSPDDLPDDGEEVTVITDHGIYTGHVGDAYGDGLGVELGTIVVDWDDVIGWFYFGLEEIVQ